MRLRRRAKLRHHVEHGLVAFTRSRQHMRPDAALCVMNRVQNDACLRRDVPALHDRPCSVLPTLKNNKKPPRATARQIGSRTTQTSQPFAIT